MTSSFSRQTTANLSNTVPPLAPLTVFYSVSDSLEFHQVIQAGVSLCNEALIYLEHIYPALQTYLTYMSSILGSFYILG